MPLKPKILILNTTGTSNKGDMAVTICHINCIKSLIPEAQITLLSGDVDTDSFYKQFQVEVRKHPWYRRKSSKLLTLATSLALMGLSLVQKIFYTIVQKINKNWRYPLSEYDIVLDITADRLNQPAWGVFACLYSLSITFLATVLIGKHVVMGPVSIGPLTSSFTRWLAGYVLNKVDIITTREAITKDYLTSIGVNKPRIEMAADMAFLLEPLISSEVDKIIEDYTPARSGKPVIGVVVRMFVWEQVEQYYQLMADVIDCIIENLQAQVWLVPHDKGPHVYWKDEEVCREIRGQANQPLEVAIFPDTLNPMEVKGILSKCDLVITWKLHGAIAATSSGVPTIAISYGDKFVGIFADMMNQEENCIDLREMKQAQVLSGIKSRIESIWKRRAAISKELAARTTIAREIAMSHGKLVKALVQSHTETPV